MLYHSIDAIPKIIPRRWHRRSTYRTSAPCTLKVPFSLVKCDSRTMTTNYLASAGSIYSSLAEWMNDDDDDDDSTSQLNVDEKWFSSKWLLLLYYFINIAAHSLYMHSKGEALLTVTNGKIRRNYSYPTKTIDRIVDFCLRIGFTSFTTWSQWIISFT